MHSSNIQLISGLYALFLSIIIISHFFVILSQFTNKIKYLTGGFKNCQNVTLQPKKNLKLENHSYVKKVITPLPHPPWTSLDD